ncbi:DUF3291 domain-containing protein [Reinekea blandensis]|uniref:DUF3291 domain-containing protein n=1 Tax=Reinekea blandensis MED297 TaxID=314283 RepID=A4BK13_9GAMM|nr:DUF3291 domain-containing protein [Reinekea blandensis]EAR07546.1 hypothetical protein MED297_04739 [Reinekea sp. MED297] [Reinekea blandensis MED297]
MHFHLAQLNIAELKAPLDSPELADFVNNLDRINALAESSPGFIWRLQTDDGDATELRPFGDDVIVNISVWESIDALHNYVYRSAHTEIMKRRKEWFHRMVNAYSVLWWVPAGHQPTPAEAHERLTWLREKGPHAQAFTFKKRFDPSGEESGI